MNTFIYGVFVSHGGLGGPLSFFGLLIHQRRGDRAVGSEGFCLSPVIIATMTNRFTKPSPYCSDNFLISQSCNIFHTYGCYSNI
jgi:hypothetical protein